MKYGRNSAIPDRQYIQVKEALHVVKFKSSFRDLPMFLIGLEHAYVLTDLENLAKILMDG